MPETPTREEAIRILADLIQDVPVAMLTTTGMGRLRSRPMVTQRAPFDGFLWFLTARAAGKTGEIRDRQAVHVTFVSDGDNRYVWASGTAALVDDRARVEAIWHDGYRPWFPAGPGDPAIALIRVRVEEAGYWDAASNRMTLLGGFVEGSAFRDLQPGAGI
ncbi:MAG TPA: pyridoxamine 5'-phosphate oxidase family protein [Vicinamibacterales bacterium]|nr:pyridoxamine 5'-phosphate oxidase family protein [Vicinamibacterales bacterium]